jgi:hypothetical protein
MFPAVGWGVQAVEITGHHDQMGAVACAVPDSDVCLDGIADAAGENVQRGGDSSARWLSQREKLSAVGGQETEITLTY